MYLVNVGQEHSRPDLVFKQSKLRNNFIFGILYLPVFYTFLQHNKAYSEDFYLVSDMFIQCITWIMMLNINLR